MIRANAEVAPLLFGLLERRINGIKADNMFVMSAFNFGENYISNFDFADSALRRRQIFIQYTPSAKDIVEYAKNNDYNDVVVEVMESLETPYLISHDTTTNELEQDTQLGSWNLLSNRWNSMGINDYKRAIDDILVFGKYMFSRGVQSMIGEKLAIFQEVSEIDVHKEFILKDGFSDNVTVYSKNGKVYDKTNKEKELQIRVKSFIVNTVFNKDEKYLLDNLENIIRAYYNSNIMLIALLKEIKNKIIFLEGKKAKTKQLEKVKNYFNEALVALNNISNDNNHKYNKKISVVIEQISTTL